MLARWIHALLMLGIAGWLAGCGGGVDEPPPDVAAPTITAQPVSQRVMAPDAAGFDVATSGSASTYQWQLCTDANPTCVTWSDIVAAVSASYSTGATDVAMSGRRYRMLASNSRGSVASATVTLTVDPTAVAPVITGQPADASVVAPAAASFTVAYSGVPTPTPQWQYSDDGSTWLDLGVSDATYGTGPTSTSDSGRHFRVILNGTLGSVTSNTVTLSVAPAAVAPSITTHPASQTVSAPVAATFTVAASGTPAPTLQWQLSSDGGSNWADIAGATAASYTTPATSVGNSGVQYRAAAANGAGTANSHAATLTVNAAPPPAGSWQTAGLIETDNLGEAVGPQVAFNAAGDGMAVWYQFDGTNYNIWANRYVAATGWGTATLIETAAGHAYVPQVAVDASGNATVVWYQTDANGRNNIWANRYAVGPGWGAPTMIETNGPTVGDDQLPRIAMDANGNVIAVWELSSFSSTTVWANRYVPGTGWGSASQIGSGNASVLHVSPQIAVDSAGNGFAVWPQYNGSITNIWGNRFVTGTGWGAAALIQSDSASSGRDPKIAADVNGNAMVVWAQFDVATSTDHIWANRYVAGTGWATSTLVQTNNATHQANLPKIAFDAAGNAIAVWNQAAFGSFSIYAARFVAGTGWTTETLIETHAGGSSTANVSIDMNASGNAMVVWQLVDASAFMDIWANRYTAGTGWDTATQIEPGNLRTGQATSPQIAINASGDAVAVWQRRNGTRFDIWASSYR